MHTRYTAKPLGQRTSGNVAAPGSLSLQWIPPSGVVPYMLRGSICLEGPLGLGILTNGTRAYSEIAVKNREASVRLLHALYQPKRRMTGELLANFCDALLMMSHFEQTWLIQEGRLRRPVKKDDNRQSTWQHIS